MEQYENIQQLLKKEPGTKERVPIFPPTVIQAVFDGKTGASLEAILAQFNSVTVQYQGSPRDTRLAIPMEMRRPGLTITYTTVEGDTLTERANSHGKDDQFWCLDANWSTIDDLSLQGEISVSAKGNWIINGVDTGVPARGPRGFNGGMAYMRLYNNSVVQYSVDQLVWKDLFHLDLITPKINFTSPVQLAPGATPTVTNRGDDYNVNLQFGLPAAPKVKIGSIGKVAYNQNPTVSNSGTEYDVILNFNLQQGNPGAKGDKGDGWKADGFVDYVASLPQDATDGTTYLVGTTQPYSIYVRKGSVWVNTGTVNEIKSGVFDGGRADSTYGGARTIDCGRADI